MGNFNRMPETFKVTLHAYFSTVRNTHPPNTTLDLRKPLHRTCIDFIRIKVTLCAESVDCQ